MNEEQRKREGEGGKGKDGEGPRAGPIAKENNYNYVGTKGEADCIVKLTMWFEFVHNTMLLCTIVVPQS